VENVEPLSEARVLWLNEAAQAHVPCMQALQRRVDSLKALVAEPYCPGTDPVLLAELDMLKRGHDATVADLQSQLQEREAELAGAHVPTRAPACARAAACDSAKSDFERMQLVSARHAAVHHA
jgi:hypothetical protein